MNIYFILTHQQIIAAQTHYKPTETFQYRNFYLCHLPCIQKGFIKKDDLAQVLVEPWIKTFV